MPAITELICYNCFQGRETLKGPCPYCGFDLEENEKKYPVALRAGTILNHRYIVGRVLGQGGFGITYLAWDTQLDAKVAVKEYMPGELAGRMDGTTVSILSEECRENFTYGAERFQEEARTLAKFIGNPNIAAVTSYFDENNTSYFVMDYVEGISFKTYIANAGGKVSVQEALDVMIPVLQALTAVHAEGFIHRDVTPDNIYITKDGNVKLLDFGSARYSIGDKSKSLDVILKVGYAPKEQYIRRSRQGPYTDVYSCAACFYGALTGFLPPESLERLDEDTLVPVSQCGVEIPEYLDKAILKGLAVQPEDRFQTAGEFLEAIENRQVVEVKPREQEKKTRKKKIPAVLMGGATAAAVLAAVGVGYLASGGARVQKPAAAVQAEAETAKPVKEVMIGEQLYSSDLTELDLTDAGLANEDLTALSQLPDLTKLSLEGNSGITDLSPLSSLTNLESLNLMYTGATDLTPLSGLVNLRELEIANPDISDLTPLSGLTNLQSLRLDDGNLTGSQITDLSPLAGLVNLESLYIPPQPNYTDFSCLSGLTKLRYFWMVGTRDSRTNTISSLDFLADMNQMEELCLVIQQGDLTVIADMENLRVLKFHGILYTPDTSIFRNLTNLEELSFRLDNTEGLCTAADMSDFAGMTHLKTFVIGLKGLSSLHGLENLTEMTELDLTVYGGEPPVTDLSPLSNMKNLRRFTFRMNPQNGPALNVAALSGLENLQSVEIQPGSRIGDTASLSHIPNVVLSD